MFITSVNWILPYIVFICTLSSIHWCNSEDIHMAYIVFYWYHDFTITHEIFQDYCGVFQRCLALFQHTLWYYFFQGCPISPYLLQMCLLQRVTMFTSDVLLLATLIQRFSGLVMGRYIFTYRVHAITHILSGCCYWIILSPSMRYLCQTVVWFKSFVRTSSSKYKLGSFPTEIVM